MANITAKIGGVHILALGNVGWSFTPGVNPHQRVFMIHRADLYKLLASRKDPFGIELILESDDDNFRVEGLWFIRAVPSSHPDQVGVLISDVRWKWRYKWILRRYNIVRRTGNRRLVSGDDTVLKQLQISVDNLKYAPFSLKPPDFTKRWEEKDVIEDILEDVTDSRYVIQDGIYRNTIDVQGLEFDDDGASAVFRALQLVPGSNCFIDDQGATQIYSTIDGSEANFIKTLGSRFVGSSLEENVSVATERPSKVFVHFSCEDEMRFDFVETTTPTTRTVDGRWMRNVMPCPCSLTIQGSLIPAGAWVEINDTLFAAMATAYPPQTPAGKILPTLTTSILRQIWCNGGYNVYMECLSSLTQDPVWATFLALLRKHYRQTFQVNQRWADRIIAYLPKRVALIDEINNVWGQPSVFANYAVLPSYRRIGRTDADPTQLVYNKVPFPSPADAPTVNLSNIPDQQAHATVDILDGELGIFHINYFTDVQGETLGVLPSNIEGFSPGNPNASFDIPSAKVDNPLKVLSHSRLKGDHALSLVITVMTGAPNNLNQTWVEEVSKVDIKDKLPVAVANQLGTEDFGPEMHVHVGPTIQTARFAWSDSFSPEIESVILGTSETGRSLYDHLLVNNEVVRDIALSQAANIYSKMIDHWEGEPISIYNDDIKGRGLTGRSGYTEHGVTPEGVMYTKVNLPAPTKGIDFWGFLGESARRAIRRILPR